MVTEITAPISKAYVSTQVPFKAHKNCLTNSILRQALLLSIIFVFDAKSVGNALN